MISRKEVEHIARLARIELSEVEKAKFEKELAGILKFVEKLNEVDVSKVGPLTPLETEFLTGLAGGTDLVNVMREDISQGTGDRGQGAGLIDVAPKKRDGYVEVKAVFERES